MGVLCLANRDQSLTEEDEQLLNAVAGHAAVSLQNAQLFRRMDKANRHWLEVFDAISDLIVVHDEACNVLTLAGVIQRKGKEYFFTSPVFTKVLQQSYDLEYLFRKVKEEGI